MVDDAEWLWTRKLVQVAVQTVLDAVLETIAKEGRIELRNFGIFELKRRAARKARNPRTGGQVDVAEKHVITFKPGKEMQQRVDFVRLLTHRPQMIPPHARR